MVTMIQYGIPPPAHQSSSFSHFSFRSLSENFECKVFSLSVYSSNLRNFSYHIIKGLYATFSSWHIDPCRLMFVADGTFPPATAYCFLKVGNAPLSL